MDEAQQSIEIAGQTISRDDIESITFTREGYKITIEKADKEPEPIGFKAAAE